MRAAREWQADRAAENLFGGRFLSSGRKNGSD